MLIRPRSTCPAPALSIAWLLVIALFVLSITSARATPSIFWASDPVSPGETVLITGDDLQFLSSILIYRISDSASEPRNDDGLWKRSVRVTALQANGQSVKFAIPLHFAPGIYRFKLIGKTGSTSSYLNIARPYWLQGDEGPVATPGGWVRILGRDIVRSRLGALFLVSSEREIKLLPLNWSLWDAKFTLPKDIPLGTYQVKLWNGQGDVTSLVTVGTVAIQPPRISLNKLVNVEDYGAVGDGLHDDTSAVKSALNALREYGGGTLSFPRGRFLLSDEVVIPKNVTIRGQARDLTSLNWPEFERPPTALLSGISDFTVTHLTIYAANYETVISGGFPANMTEPQTDPKNITVDDVMIRASAYRGHLTADQARDRFLSTAGHPPPNGPVALRLSGRNLKITNSDVYSSGSSFLLYHAEGAYVARNKFANGRDGWYSITSADRVILEDNEISGADLQSTGGGINTLDSTAAFSQHVLFFHNNFSLLHGWDREAVTTDGPGGYYYGHVQASNSQQLVLLDPLAEFGLDGHDWAGAAVFIVAGKGAGEFKRVVGFEKKTVQLDSPLSVAPDHNSLVTIVPMQGEHLIIGNTFSDAGIAVQLFGTAVNVIVAENTSIRAGGFKDQALVYRHFQPSWYNQFLANTIPEGNLYDPGGGKNTPSGSVVGVYGREIDSSAPPLCRGIIIRGNILSNNSQISISGGEIGGANGIVDVIVENNRVFNSDVGISIDVGAKEIFMDNNDLKDIRNELHGNLGAR